MLYKIHQTFTKITYGLDAFYLMFGISYLPASKRIVVLQTA